MAKTKKDTLFTPIGVAAFANLWVPFKFPDKPGQKVQEPMFRLTLVLTAEQWKNDPDAQKIKAGVKAAMLEKFGADQLAAMMKKTGKSAVSLPWRPVSDFAEYGEPFTTTPGGMVLTLKSRDKPGIVGPDTDVISDPQEVYSGMKCRASCVAWAFDTAGNQGCTLLMNNVQKAGEGKRLSGRADPTKEFGAVEGGGGDPFGEGDDGDNPFA